MDAEGTPTPTFEIPPIMMEKLQSYSPPYPDRSPLYHYCPPDSFHAIITNKTIRLSDSQKSNDEREFLHGLSIVEAFWNETKYKFDEAFQKSFEAVYEEVKKVSRPLILSLSRNGDVLSQWRAYSDDGRGFAIGFNPEAISALDGRIGSVVYDKKQQERVIKSYIIYCYKYWIKNGHKEPDFFFGFAANITGMCNYFKEPAFKEEKEVRVLLTAMVMESGKSKSIINPFAEDEGRNGVEVRFLMRNARITPYVEAPLPESPSPIRRIILGPKNPNGVADVAALLGTAGYKPVRIDRSAASYR